jgi:hypothetical protein
MRKNHQKLVVLVPVYRPELTGWEQLSFARSTSNLVGREVELIAPTELNIDWYLSYCPHAKTRRFEKEYFSSIQGYNRLLLDPAFYEEYGNYDFMLILQTDAMLISQEIDQWLHKPFDYIGAPWPAGLELFVNLGRFEGNCGRKVIAKVGNGGFSLRRNSKCAALLQEFAVERDHFKKTGSSEDLFFGFMGQLSQDFVVPNEITASQFAIESGAELYTKINKEILPVGLHAWWRYDLEFWKRRLDLAI